MRGEDEALHRARPGLRGSPPHARGRLHVVPLAFRHARITPACAGKTSVGFLSVLLGGGSPPHARGRHPRRNQRGRYPRITPACAGKTFRFHVDDHELQDHPRMRGEDSHKAMPENARSGSPPHARGRRRRPLRGRHAGGITPACAGKTPGRSVSSSRPRDHPRMRGEDVKKENKQ